MSRALFLALLSNVWAPEPTDPAGASAVWTEAFGVNEVDGDLVGGGPNYRVRFDDEGFDFSALLPANARGDAGLRFALESIWLGDRLLHRASPTSPRLDGSTVRYEREAEILESYEVRREGVEQTFRFETRPEGSGDLVVRGRLRTSLPASTDAETERGLRFDVGDLGGLSYGSVTGIDAAGRKAPGTLRFDGTQLEMRLPRSFVDEASFPLVLDPLVGSTITVSAGPASSPDVAYDATNDVYLVVWEVVTVILFPPATTSDVRAQRLTGAGALVGPMLTLATGSAYTPSVGGVNHTDTFLVAWRVPSGVPLTGGSIEARTVDAATGVLSPTATVASVGTALSSISDPDVGGDSRLGLVIAPANRAVVVWAQSSISSSGIKARTVICPGGGVTPSFPSSVVDLTTTSSDSAPAITKHAGSFGRYLVAWKRGPSFPGDIYARAFHNTGSACGPEIPVADDPLLNEFAPNCATEPGESASTDFLVVWLEQLVPGIADARARKVLYTGLNCGSGLLSTPSPSVFVASVVSETDRPAIDFAKWKYVFAWTSASAALPGVRIQALDPETCVTCEASTVVETSSESPAVAAQASGSSSAGDGALVSWVSSGNEIRARRFDAMGNGGSILLWALPCGGGGILSGNGPAAIGNTDFALDLAGASAGATSGLFVLSPTAANLGCGPCTLVPSLNTVVVSTPISSGAASFPLPIPCNVAFLGAQVYVQWIVFPTPTSPCAIAPNVSLSNALRIELGL